MLALDIGVDALDGNLLFGREANARTRSQCRARQFVVDYDIVAGLLAFGGDNEATTHSKFLRQQVFEDHAQRDREFIAKIKVEYRFDIIQPCFNLAR